jgi:hypothetical protein
MATAISEMNTKDAAPVNKPMVMSSPAIISELAATRACKTGHFIPIDLNHPAVPDRPEGETTLLQPWDIIERPKPTRRIRSATSILSMSETIGDDLENA